MLHIDVWGPYRVQTRGNYRYFLTIVDDCSRATWIQLLRAKSDSFNVIRKFVMFALEFNDQYCRQSKADYSLFTIQQKSTFVAVLVYVDDLLITGNDTTAIEALKS